MVCEKCGGEVDAVECRSCSATVLKLGSYCYMCGAILAREVQGERDDDPLDLSSRILCSDGACIGVIGEDGLCKVCGKPFVPES